jgi:lipid II:glycine glycyltransferase (peptidoglycan interpeptide bridge formation enzyme)
MSLASPTSFDIEKDGSFGSEACTVRTSRELRDPDWDNYLSTCPGGHHEQSSLWGEVKSHYGWKPVRIIFNKGKRIIGGAQILTRSLGRWGKIGYVSRGPSGISDDPELTDLILRQLDSTSAKEKLAYLAVVLPYNGQGFEPGLNRLGFRRKPDVLPPGEVMTATLLLDLSPDVDSLMAGMRMSTRQNVRRAVKRGVTVREGGAHDVETFRELMWALCKRRGISPSPHQKGFFERLWNAFHPAGYVRLFMAELDGRVVSAGLTFPFGDTVRIWKIGWAGDQAKSSPNELLYWEAIRWSKLNGYRFFDFVSIENSLARTLKTGDPVDWSSIKGPSNFKLGFGGNPTLLPDPYYRFYHPILRAFGRAGGSRLVESRAVERYLGRFMSGLSSRG